MPKLSEDLYNKLLIASPCVEPPAVGTDADDISRQYIEWAFFSILDMLPEDRAEIGAYLGAELHLDEDGLKHKDGGPAVITPDGYVGYYQHGKRHRVDGPAVRRADGSEEWWVNGERVDKQD